MIKHTPGPWEAIQLGGDNGVRHVWAMDSDGGSQVATTFPVAGSLDAQEDNARLIAAAPEMLSELERLLDVVGEADVGCIEAVIRRAKGETE